MLNIEWQWTVAWGGWWADGKTVTILSFLFSSLLYCLYIMFAFLSCGNRTLQQVIDKVRGQRAKHDTAQKNRRVSWPSTLSLLSPSGFSHFSLCFLLIFLLIFFFLFSSNFSFFFFLVFPFSPSVSLSSSLLWSAISLLYIPAVYVCVGVSVCVTGEFLAHVVVCIFCVYFVYEISQRCVCVHVCTYRMFASFDADSLWFVYLWTRRLRLYVCLPVCVCLCVCCDILSDAWCEGLWLFFPGLLQHIMMPVGRHVHS